MSPIIIFPDEINKPMNSSEIINIIVIDDEALTRQSTVRMIKKTAVYKCLNLNIMEAEDGIEGAYLVFRNL